MTSVFPLSALEQKEKNQTTNNPTPALAIPQSRCLLSTLTMSKTLASLIGKTVPLHMKMDSPL